MQSSVRSGLRVSIDNFHETFLTQRETLKLRGHMNRDKVVDLTPITSKTIDDTSYDFSPSEVGGFGLGDFVIEMDLTGEGFNAFDNDRDYGALFIRSGEFDSPYSGPAVFIFGSGKILFRIRGDDGLECEGALPNPGSAITRHVKFSRTGDTLAVVTPTASCSKAITKQYPSEAAAQVRAAPLRFRGNHEDSKDQSLYMEVTNVKFDQGEERTMYGVPFETEQELEAAVDACASKSQHYQTGCLHMRAKYGWPMNAWNVGCITDMSHLFKGVGGAATPGGRRGPSPRGNRASPASSSRGLAWGRGAAERDSRRAEDGGVVSKWCRVH